MQSVERHTVARQVAARRIRPFPRLPHGHPPLPVLVPAVVVACAMLLPLVYLLVRAAEADARVWTTVLRLRTLRVLGRTLLLTGSVTALTIGLALPLAWLTSRSDLPGRRFWTVATTVPLVIPSFLGAYAFIAALGPRGMVQQMLQPLGITRLPEIYGFWGSLLVLTLYTYPYVLTSVRIALHRVDPALEEAARSLGESAWRVWWRITLPQLRPAIVAGALLVALYTISDFGVVSLLQYDTLTRSIYLFYQAAFNRTPAALLGLLLILITTLILGYEARARGRARYYHISAGCARPAPVARLGRWRWPAIGLCAFVVLLAVGLPLAVIGYWALLAIRLGEPWGVTVAATYNTLRVSAMAALATTLAALPIALLAVRYPGRFGRLTERLSYVGYALPGIVIALALVFWGSRYAPALYQTLAMLVFAYVIRFLPQAVGATRAALLQINPHLEEAARGLGQRPSTVMRTVTLPLLRPGLLGGAALVLLTTMKELPATLLLSPIGFETLAVQVWSATGEAFWTRAAAPALFLLLVAVIPATLLTLGKNDQ